VEQVERNVDRARLRRVAAAGATRTSFSCSSKSFQPAAKSGSPAFPPRGPQAEAARHAQVRGLRRGVRAGCERDREVRARATAAQELAARDRRARGEQRQAEVVQRELAIEAERLQRDRARERELAVAFAHRQPYRRRALRRARELLDLRVDAERERRTRGQDVELRGFDSRAREAPGPGLGVGRRICRRRALARAPARRTSRAPEQASADGSRSTTRRSFVSSTSATAACCFTTSILSSTTDSLSNWIAGPSSSGTFTLTAESESVPDTSCAPAVSKLCSITASSVPSRSLQPNIFKYTRTPPIGRFESVILECTAGPACLVSTSASKPIVPPPPSSASSSVPAPHRSGRSSASLRAAMLSIAKS
jgi:hypothetical protein